MEEGGTGRSLTLAFSVIFEVIAIMANRLKSLAPLRKTISKTISGQTGPLQQASQPLNRILRTSVCLQSCTTISRLVFPIKRVCRDYGHAWRNPLRSLRQHSPTLALPPSPSSCWSEKTGWRRWKRRITVCPLLPTPCCRKSRSRWSWGRVQRRPRGPYSKP